MPLHEVPARDEGASNTCHRAHLRGEKALYAFYSVTEFSMDKGRECLWNNLKGVQTGFLRQARRHRNPAVFQSIISSRHSNRIKSKTRAALVKCRSRLPSTKGITNERFYDASMHRETRGFLWRASGEITNLSGKSCCPNHSCSTKFPIL